MKTEHEFLIFVYYLCIILITMILFSFIFNIITSRLFGDYPKKTKIYYMEFFGIWLILMYLMINFRKKINTESKKHLTDYVRSNGEIGEYSYIYSQIDELEKFNMLIIIGFIVIFIGSQQHTYREKLLLLNEDIGVFGEFLR